MCNVVVCISYKNESDYNINRMLLEGSYESFSEKNDFKCNLKFVELDDLLNANMEDVDCLIFDLYGYFEDDVYSVFNDIKEKSFLSDREIFLLTTDTEFLRKKGVITSRDFMRGTHVVLNKGFLKIFIKPLNYKDLMKSIKASSKKIEEAV